MMKKGLGRGLEALFKVYDEPEEKKEKPVERPQETKETSVRVESVSNIGAAPVAPQQKPSNDGVTEIDIKLIDPNRNQPRKTFDATSLKELAESIKQHGIIQPIVVNEQGNRYMIIAGERRFRASLIAGLKTVPAVIKHYNDRQVKEVSIIENLQREDLNPIEAARAIKELMEEYNFTQETVADRIGKSRPAIANTLRLLTLYPEVIDLIAKNKLSAGHARCLVVVTDREMQFKLASQACDNKMTVRDLEKAVKEYLNPKASKAKKQQEQSLELKDLINTMQRTFATKVSAIGNDRRGRIYIDYYSRDDLDRICEFMEILRDKSKPEEE